jgi:hypothetical protein
MNVSDEPGKTNDVGPIDREAIEPSDDTSSEETQDDPAVTGEIDGD